MTYVSLVMSLTMQCLYLQHNRIHHIKRSGIVVLGSGQGTIKANDIYQNREAGIYILYRGDPYVTYVPQSVKYLSFWTFFFWMRKDLLFVLNTHHKWTFGKYLWLFSNYFITVWKCFASSARIYKREVHTLLFTIWWRLFCILVGIVSATGQHQALL